MEKKLFYFIFIIIFKLLLINNLNAQIFENIYDARSEALGRAASVLGSDAVLFGNPAVDIVKSKSLVTVGAQTRFLLTDIQLASLGGLISKKEQNFGFSAQYLGNQYLSKWSLSGQYARQLLKKLNFGVRIRGGQLDFGQYNKRFIFDGDLGIFSALNTRLSFGAMLQNISRFEIDNTEQSVSILRLGARYSPSKKVAMLLEIRQDFNTGIGVGCGVEYAPAEMLKFQIGLQTNPTKPSFGINYTLNNKIFISSFANYHAQLGLSSGLNLGLFF